MTFTSRASRHVSFSLEPIKLLLEAQKETVALMRLARNISSFVRESAIFQHVESELSNLKKDIDQVYNRFHRLSQDERREKGNDLIWKICQIRTLIQENLKTPLEAKVTFNLKDLSGRLTKIETNYIHPVIASTIDPSH